MLPETGYTGSNSGSYWSNLLGNLLPNRYSFIKAVVIWEMPSAGLTVVNSATLPSFKQGIFSNYYSSNIYSSLNASPIAAIGETPSYNSQSASPLDASTSSNKSGATSWFNWYVAYVVILIAAFSTVAIVLKNLKKRRRALDNREVNRKPMRDYPAKFFRK